LPTFLKNKNVEKIKRLKNLKNVTKIKKLKKRLLLYAFEVTGKDLSRYVNLIKLN